MFKKIIITVLLLVTLSSCGVKPVPFSTDNFSILIPENWIVEQDIIKLPKGVLLAALYRDLENDLIYSVNISSESFAKLSISTEEYFGKNKLLLEQSENYELISEEDFELKSGEESYLHVFKDNNKEYLRTFIQSYSIDKNKNIGYVVTASMPIMIPDSTFNQRYC